MQGHVKVACEAPCTHAGFHGKTPPEFWVHLREAHAWDGKLETEPPRLLDSLEAPLVADVMPSRLFGPSKEKREKARAKRKRRKNK